MQPFFNFFFSFIRYFKSNLYITKKHRTFHITLNVKLKTTIPATAKPLFKAFKSKAAPEIAPESLVSELEPVPSDRDPDSLESPEVKDPNPDPEPSDDSKDPPLVSDDSPVAKLAVGESLAVSNAELASEDMSDASSKPDSAAEATSLVIEPSALAPVSDPVSRAADAVSKADCAPVRAAAPADSTPDASACATAYLIALIPILIVYICFLILIYAIM